MLYLGPKADKLIPALAIFFFSFYLFYMLQYIKKILFVCSHSQSLDCGKHHPQATHLGRLTHTMIPRRLTGNMPRCLCVRCLAMCTYFLWLQVRGGVGGENEMQKREGAPGQGTFGKTWPLWVKKLNCETLKHTTNPSCVSIVNSGRL